MSPVKTLIQSIGIMLGNIELTPEQENVRELLWETRRIDCSCRLKNTRFVVLDTETTGLNPYNGDKVISLGAIVVENGRINEKKTFYELVNPERNIPKKITELTGITQEMVKDKPPLIEVLNRFVPWASDSVLVGHVVNFDLAFLNRYLSRNCSAKFKHRAIDTRELAMCLYSDLNAYSLEEICSFLEITCEQRHHALGDAVSAAKLLENFIEQLSEKGLQTILDLQNVIRHRELIRPASTLVCN